MTNKTQDVGPVCNQCGAVGEATKMKGQYWCRACLSPPPSAEYMAAEFEYWAGHKSQVRDSDLPSTTTGVGFNRELVAMTKRMREIGIPMFDVRTKMDEEYRLARAEKETR